MIISEIQSYVSPLILDMFSLKSLNVCWVRMILNVHKTNILDVFVCPRRPKRHKHADIQNIYGQTGTLPGDSETAVIVGIYSLQIT